MSHDRAQILANLRKRGAGTPPPLPQVGGGEDAWIRFPDRVAAFTAALPLVGGKAEVVANRASLLSAIQELAVVQEAARLYSRVSGVRGNVTVTSETDPRSLEDLDVTVAPASIGVAENGALWIDGAGFAQRAALFLAQHVVFTIEASAIVNNMHEAYDRIAFQHAGYGVFISGPSKTADIEQSLVIGAHGPRSATVFVCQEP